MLWNMKVTIIPIVIGALGTVPQGLIRGLEELEVEGLAETIQTIKIDQNTEESSEDLTRLAVTQTPRWFEKLARRWLRKGNFKRETESLLIAAQDSALRTNHIKARIDKTQQNSKCWLCGDRD